MDTKPDPARDAFYAKLYGKPKAEPRVIVSLVGGKWAARFEGDVPQGLREAILRAIEDHAP